MMWFIFLWAHFFIIYANCKPILDEVNTGALRGDVQLGTPITNSGVEVGLGEDEKVIVNSDLESTFMSSTPRQKTIDNGFESGLKDENVAPLNGEVQSKNLIKPITKENTSSVKTLRSMGMKENDDGKNIIVTSTPRRKIIFGEPGTKQEGNLVNKNLKSGRYANYFAPRRISRKPYLASNNFDDNFGLNNINRFLNITLYHDNNNIPIGKIARRLPNTFLNITLIPSELSSFLNNIAEIPEKALLNSEWQDLNNDQSNNKLEPREILNTESLLPTKRKESLLHKPKLLPMSDETETAENFIIPLTNNEINDMTREIPSIPITKLEKKSVDFEDNKPSKTRIISSTEMGESNTPISDITNESSVVSSINEESIETSEETYFKATTKIEEKNEDFEDNKLSETLNVSTTKTDESNVSISDITNKSSIPSSTNEESGDTSEETSSELINKFDNKNEAYPTDSTDISSIETDESNTSISDITSKSSLLSSNNEKTSYATKETSSEPTMKFKEKCVNSEDSKSKTSPKVSSIEPDGSNASVSDIISDSFMPSSTNEEYSDTSEETSSKATTKPDQKNGDFEDNKLKTTPKVSSIEQDGSNASESDIIGDSFIPPSTNEESTDTTEETSSKATTKLEEKNDDFEENKSSESLIVYSSETYESNASISNITNKSSKLSSTNEESGDTNEETSSESKNKFEKKNDDSEHNKPTETRDVSSTETDESNTSISDITSTNSILLSTNEESIDTTEETSFKPTTKSGEKNINSEDNKPTETLNVSSTETDKSISSISDVISKNSILSSTNEETSDTTEEASLKPITKPARKETDIDRSDYESDIIDENPVFTSNPDASCDVSSSNCNESDSSETHIPDESSIFTSKSKDIPDNSLREANEKDLSEFDITDKKSICTLNSDETCDYSFSETNLSDLSELDIAHEKTVSASNVDKVSDNVSTETIESDLSELNITDHSHVPLSTNVETSDTTEEESSKPITKPARKATDIDRSDYESDTVDEKSVFTSNPDESCDVSSSDESDSSEINITDEDRSSIFTLKPKEISDDSFREMYEKDLSELDIAPVSSQNSVRNTKPLRNKPALYKPNMTPNSSSSEEVESNSSDSEIIDETNIPSLMYENTMDLIEDAKPSIANTNYERNTKPPRNKMDLSIYNKKPKMNPNSSSSEEVESNSSDSEIIDETNIPSLMYESTIDSIEDTKPSIPNTNYVRNKPKVTPAVNKNYPKKSNEPIMIPGRSNPLTKTRRGKKPIVTENTSFRAPDESNSSKFDITVLNSLPSSIIEESSDTTVGIVSKPIPRRKELPDNLKSLVPNRKNRNKKTGFDESNDTSIYEPKAVPAAIKGTNRPKKLKKHSVTMDDSFSKPDELNIKKRPIITSNDSFGSPELNNSLPPKKVRKTKLPKHKRKTKKNQPIKTKRKHSKNKGTPNNVSKKNPASFKVKKAPKYQAYPVELGEEIPVDRKITDEVPKSLNSKRKKNNPNKNLIGLFDSDKPNSPDKIIDDQLLSLEEKKKNYKVPSNSRLGENTILTPVTLPVSGKRKIKKSRETQVDSNMQGSFKPDDSIEKLNLYYKPITSNQDDADKYLEDLSNDYGIDLQNFPKETENSQDKLGPVSNEDFDTSPVLNIDDYIKSMDLFSISELSDEQCKILLEKYIKFHEKDPNFKLIFNNKPLKYIIPSAVLRMYSLEKRILCFIKYNKVSDQDQQIDYSLMKKVKPYLDDVSYQLKNEYGLNIVSSQTFYLLRMGLYQILKKNLKCSRVNIYEYLRRAIRSIPRHKSLNHAPIYDTLISTCKKAKSDFTLKPSPSIRPENPFISKIVQTLNINNQIFVDLLYTKKITYSINTLINFTSEQLAFDFIVEFIKQFKLDEINKIDKWDYFISLISITLDTMSIISAQGFSDVMKNLRITEKLPEIDYYLGENQLLHQRYHRFLLISSEYFERNMQPNKLSLVYNPDASYGVNNDDITYEEGKKENIDIKRKVDNKKINKNNGLLGLNLSLGDLLKVEGNLGNQKYNDYSDNTSIQSFENTNHKYHMRSNENRKNRNPRKKNLLNIRANIGN